MENSNTTLTDATHAHWASQANRIMFALMDKYPDGFCADQFYVMCCAEKFPPNIIKRYAGKLFREFRAAGYLQKTKNYRLSERNGSTPLPIWKKTARTRPEINTVIAP